MWTIVTSEELLVSITISEVSDVVSSKIHSPQYKRRVYRRLERKGLSRITSYIQKQIVAKFKTDSVCVGALCISEFNV